MVKPWDTHTDKGWILRKVFGEQGCHWQPGTSFTLTIEIQQAERTSGERLHIRVFLGSQLSRPFFQLYYIIVLLSFFSPKLELYFAWFKQIPNIIFAYLLMLKLILYKRNKHESVTKEPRFYAWFWMKMDSFASLHHFSQHAVWLPF